MAHCNLNRPMTILLGLGLLAAGGCASQPAQSVERSVASLPPVQTAAVPEAVAAPSEAPLALERAAHSSAMSEVVLDATAASALTLDVDGAVRLWTELDPAQARAPLALPAQEPSWMSLARSEGGFVAGFIDTAGGGSVVRVEVDGERATMSTLFEIPASDPLFEMHVLEGGERILVLGIDHRVRLYDSRGAEVSVLDPMGFVPWQLRVVQNAGAPVSIVAVLAGPTRVQLIALEGDALKLQGEPRVVEIDQGPNRNDLSLLPDGRTVVAMRRPRARKRRFTFELVDLQTDARRLIATEVDTSDRPRVLPVDGDRLLLESGSGQGFWLDLSQAVPWTEGTSREETEELPNTATREVRLPGSTAARRVHVALSSGVRAVPVFDQLLVDPVDDDRYVQLGSAALDPVAVALDEEGQRVAWSSGQSIIIDEGQADRMHSIPNPGGRVAELAFIGSDRLLVLGGDGRAAIIDQADGQVISRTRLAADWGVSKAGFRRGEAFGEGTLAVLPVRPGEPIRALDVGDGDFGESRDEPRWQRARWSQMGTRERDALGVLAALGFDALAADSVAALVEDDHGHHLIASDSIHPTLHRVGDDGTASIPLREGFVERVTPDSSGTRVAVVQRIRGAANSELHVVSVVDMTTEQRLWSRSVRAAADVDWSHDGQRLAIAAGDGGQVLDASNGEQLLVRPHLEFRAEEIDARPADG